MDKRAGKRLGEVKGVLPAWGGVLGIFTPEVAKASPGWEGDPISPVPLFAGGSSGWGLRGAEPAGIPGAGEPGGQSPVHAAGPLAGAGGHVPSLPRGLHVGQGPGEPCCFLWGGEEQKKKKKDCFPQI